MSFYSLTEPQRDKLLDMIDLFDVPFFLNFDLGCKGKPYAVECKNYAAHFWNQ